MNGLLLVCSALMLIAAVFFNFGPDTIFFANDQALSFAVVERFLGGEIPLAGPPSHVGGRHLGPFYYWYLAFTQIVGGDLHGALVVGAFMMALSALLIGWWIGGVVGVVAVVLVAVSGYLDTIRIPWHPHILLPLSGIFLFRTWRLLKGDCQGLAWWCFWASVLGQTHSAAVPFVAGISSVVGIFSFRVTMREGWVVVLKEKIGWLCFALSVVPVACYNLFFDANLIGLFTVHSEPVAGAGYRAAVVSLGQFLWVRIFGSGAASWEGGVVLGLVCFISVGDRHVRGELMRGARANFALVLAIGVGVFFTLFALSRFKPPIYDYYWSVLLPLPLMIFATWACIVYGAGRLARWGGLLVFILFCLTSWRSLVRYADRPFVVQHTLGAAERVVDVMRSLGSERASERVQVVTRLYAHTMKNTYNFLLGPERFGELEVSYKFKELGGVASGEEGSEGAYIGEWRYVVFCPVPFSKELKRMMSGFRVGWRQVGSGVSGGVERCLVKLLRRREATG